MKGGIYIYKTRDIMILHCHWCEFWLRDTDVLIISIEMLLRDVVVFRLVAYLLIMICLKLESYTKSYLKKFWYNEIELLKFLGFSLYPLSFFLYSPFKINKPLKLWEIRTRLKPFLTELRLINNRFRKGSVRAM